MEQINSTYDQEQCSILTEYYQRYGGFWRFPQIHDFCYLVNPYFTRSKIMDEMQAFFPTLVSEYPSGMMINSQLASEYWGIKTEYVIPGNGAAELIKAFMESLSGKVGIVRPTFEEYPNRLQDDKVVVYFPTDRDFRYSADDLIEFFSKNAVETLLLVNPDNPSGNFISKKEIIKLAKWAKGQGTRFLLDESFVDFSLGHENNSCIANEILEEYPNLVVIKSISKSFGVPGLRLGILCSSDTIMISKIKKQVSIWNINSFAEYFMQILPKYRKEYKLACDQLITTREDFEKELKTIPFLHVMPSQANYFFAEVLTPYNSSQLCAILLEKYGILCSACLSKKGIEPNKYMRIAVRNHSDNKLLIEALTELV